MMYYCGPLLMDEQRQDEQLCDDTGYSHEYLPEAMVFNEGWRDRVRDIFVDSVASLR